MLTPVRTVEPSALPLTLSEVKAHLRVDHSDEDTSIQIYVEAATAYVDGYSGILGRALVTQTWRQDACSWPTDRLRLPLAPVQSITSIQYYDANNVLQTLSAGNYSLLEDARSPYAAWLSTASLPSVYDREDAIRVTFVAGYGAASAVPAAIRAALLLMVGDLHENRESVVVGQTVNETPAVKSLLAPFRRIGL